jgi:hypothetical protein
LEILAPENTKNLFIMKEHFLTLILLFGLSLPLFADGELTQTLRGTVRDEVTGAGLIGATVVIKGTEPLMGTITGNKGEFHFKNVPLGRQTLKVSYIGYYDAIVSNILLSSGKEVVLNIKLEEKAYEVDEITIRPEKKKEGSLNEMAVVSARTFSVEETERFAGSLGDPARMVANYAGVMTQNDSRNDIIIRGNSPSGVLWRLEGIEISNPNHFGAQGTTGGPVSMVNNNLLADSDFLTGAFPAEYGNALAGAFDLNLRSGNNQNTEFTGQVGFNGFEGGIEGPLNVRQEGPDPSYLINYRYSTLELMHELGFSTGTGTAVPEYQDLTFLLDVPGSRAGRFKLFGLMGKSFIALGHNAADTADNSYSARGTTTDFGSELFVTGLSHTFFFSTKAKLKTTLSYQQSSAITKIDSLEIPDVYVPFLRSKQEEDRYSVNTKYTYKFNARNNLNIGFVTDYYHLNYADSIQDNDLGRFRIMADNAGGLSLYRTYAQFQHRFPDRTLAYAGMHFQFSDFNNELSAEPRLGLRIPAGNRGKLNLGFGMHSQLQPKSVYFTETFLEEENRYILSNDDLGFTKSNHFVLGYDHLFTKNFRVKIESYYQYLYNVPVKESFPEFSMLNAGDQFGIPRIDSLSNEGTGRNYGVEFTLEKFLDKGYYFLFTASLFESEYRGYDKIWRNTAFNGNYVFNLLGGYEFRIGEKNMFTIDLKSVLAGGKRVLPIDIEESVYENTTVYDWENIYADKYDPYFRTDLRIGYKRNGKKVTQEWAVDLQNLTNYQSIFMEGFDQEDQRVYEVYQQGFVPMFLYRIQF